MSAFGELEFTRAIGHVAGTNLHNGDEAGGTAMENVLSAGLFHFGQAILWA